jgi:putative acetyltransferase
MTTRTAHRATSQAYVIRRLTRSDVRAMVSIIVTARREYDVQLRNPAPLEPSDQDLYATYQRPRSDYFVAMHEGVPAGGAGVAPLAGTDEETCELQRMYVSAYHRGRGVGRLLLAECLRRAAALGFRRCYAETISEMNEAIRFYQRNGFRRLGAPLGESGRPYIDCWMLLDLDVDAYRFSEAFPPDNNE